ncbi:MAG TPA: choice-of-anchor J domain-containing protein [Flavobacterium sp.]
MKKTLLSIALGFFFCVSYGQNLLTENFDNFAALSAEGWEVTNQSTPAGAGAWSQGGGTAFAPGGYNGGATSFTLVNFTSTTGVGTISNWLILPVISLQDGDVVTFYSRSGGVGTGTVYPDRMELRMSTTGAASVVPSGGATDLGSFTTLALSINPDLTNTGYPFTWTQFSYTVSGLPTATETRLAFRYFVENGGPDGANSNIIGLDALSIDRPSNGTAEFFNKNFTLYPNPTNDVINIDSATTTIKNIQITDINGRTVKSLNAAGVAQAQVNVSDLNSGVYFLTVDSDNGSGTTKIVKQ